MPGDFHQPANASLMRSAATLNHLESCRGLDPWLRVQPPGDPGDRRPYQYGSPPRSKAVWLDWLVQREVPHAGGADRLPEP
jgi:hypothetical protein